ncbi:hypothetical protein B0T21DRAFT_360542 [Apiosordaria backusii]|uniref:FAD-binding FR-type domain-containing protein n=1 Tax=Apiosordaria backusii TaxID=314023 RepID=A0AA40EMD6_9PEZI|nr:hypothetical protein B0T21DRAFT_360542 [Apiosordaria backusii]
MEPVYYYVIFLAALPVFAASRTLLSCVSHRIIPRITFYFTKNFRYRLLFSWFTLTPLQTLVLLLYFGMNVVALTLGISFQNLRALEQRAAKLALINFIPLFLGGVAFTALNFLNISLHSYQFMHRWVGRTATVEGILHAVVTLTLQPIPGQVPTSGYIAALLLFLLLISAVRVFWRRRQQFYRLLHYGLAAGMLGVTTWHILLLTSTDAKVLVLVSLVLLVLGTLIHTTVPLHGIRAVVTDVWIDDMVIGLEVSIKKPLQVPPGGYFYLFPSGRFSRHQLHRGYAAQALWRDVSDRRTVSGSQKAGAFTFILLKSTHASFLRLSPGDSIMLQGPYGSELKLDSYENIILTAKGMGILGVMQIAFCIALRKRHDDDIRRELREHATRETKFRLDLKTTRDLEHTILAGGWKYVPLKEDELTKQEKELGDMERSLIKKEKEISESQHQDEKGERVRFVLKQEVCRLERSRFMIIREILSIKKSLLKAREGARRNRQTQNRLFEKEKELVVLSNDWLRSLKSYLAAEKSYLTGKPLFCDSTRKVDIFWITDSNSQSGWISRNIEALQALDPNNILLIFICLNPDRVEGSLPFKQSDYFQSIYPSSRTPDMWKTMISTIHDEYKLPGKIAVVGCGNKAFIQELRKAVLEDTSRAIRFIASDFVTSCESKGTENVESPLSPASSFDKTIDSLRISV